MKGTSGIVAVLALMVCAGQSVIVSGCAPDREAIGPPPYETRLADYAEAQVDLVHAMSGRIADRVKREIDDHSAGRSAEAPVIDVLMLSGGGDYGAFGAGFLAGWGSAPAGPLARPDFDVVTGVSTGSLIAPFAYLGTQEDYQRIEDLYRHPKRDWVRRRGLLFFLPGNKSLMSIDGLKRSIDESVNGPMIARIAERAKTGRVVAIAATNTDLGVATVFDMGEEAALASARGDPGRFTQLLLASSAIPAAFPPVEVGDYLYTDGGVTANVLFRLDLRSPRGFIAEWRARHPAVPLPRIRYWVIFNNQVQTPPETAQPDWVDMAARNLGISIRSSTLAEIRLLTAKINELNLSGIGRGEVRMTAIPDGWRPPVPGTFEKETMNSLADVGRRMGADPASWTLLTHADMLP